MKVDKVSPREVIDFLKAHGKDPESELEIIAKLALKDEALSEQKYFILEHRMPFEEKDILTLPELASRYGVATSETIRQHELRGYNILAGYLHRYASSNEISDLDIRYLPWEKYRKYLNNPRSTTNALMNRIAKGYSVTVRDVELYLEKLEKFEGPVVITDLSQRSYDDVIRAVFRKEIHIELPILKIKNW